jgi:hypothetical protein
MLIRHKCELGLKHITKVTVVLSDKGIRRNNGKNPHIFYTIADVPQDGVTNPHQGRVESRSKVLNISNKGKNVIRVHTMA